MTNPLSSLAHRTARWCALHPWRAILGWVAFVAIAVGLATMVPTQDATDADYRMGESGRADALVARAGFDEPDTEQVLITAARGDLDQAAAQRAAAEVVAGMNALDGVEAVADPQVSPDGSAYLVSVQLARDQSDVAPLQAVTGDVAADFPQLSVRESGDVSLDGAIGERVGDDLGSAETISLPLTLILMLLAFGALIAAGIPVLLAGTSVAATIGLLAPLSHLVHAEDTVSSMIVLIGMAVGVDYSLFYLKREREERAKGHTTRDAVEIAAQTSGHSILVSGFAVICSMAGLFVVGDTTFNSLAVGAILVVAVAVLGSITVLPALLSKLGRWVDRPRVPFLHRALAGTKRGAVAGRVLGPVTRHPAAALALSLVVVVLLAVPALGMKTHGANLETLPSSVPEAKTMQDLSRAFPSEGTTAELVVRAPASEQAQVAAALADVEATAQGSALFQASGTPVEVSPDGTTSILILAMPFEESDARVDDAIEKLRTTYAPRALDGLDAEYAVGGDAAESYDFVQREQSRLPFVIGFVLLLTLLVMGVTFRSVPIALISAVLNLASVGVAFGLMTLVFQHGWLEGALDFSSPGFVIDWLPLFVLVVLVGLSMDYHVFVLSRIREHVQRGLPTRLAVRQGVADTAGVVTSAAAVMVSVFSIFATLSMLEMKMMGVALSGAILLDATLIRLVMLPAVLCLLGDRVWWPSRRPVPLGERVDEREFELV
ncbi:MMPL family transporter [Nocardioides anomalus]|uniref:MMPL family transporter n=1 Tax=Nocardioides anomalus TaxID=2712223 RepID=A0A6G6WB44_9ACTN|nr:MMPL family transporter [Nocardioides anomalus]QIG42436.1 MMPL family transporter [Nocardioides anomalus]